MENEVLARDADPSLVAYVVWQAKHGGQEADLAEATRLIPDPRATHWWDGSGFTLTAFRRAVGFGGDVWDAYLVYPPGVRWEEEEPPAPAYWMHQLYGVTNAPLLDGATLEAHVEALSHPSLPGTPPASRQLLGAPSAIHP